MVQLIPMEVWVVMVQLIPMEVWVVMVQLIPMEVWVVMVQLIPMLMSQNTSRMVRRWALLLSGDAGSVASIAAALLPSAPSSRPVAMSSPARCGGDGHCMGHYVGCSIYCSSVLHASWYGRVCSPQ
jgi:hypothetical protein